MTEDLEETGLALIRVLLAGEGPTDHGVVDWDSRRRKRVVKEGACQPIIRKCADQLRLVIQIAERDRIREYPTYTRYRKAPRGHGVKAWICLNIAEDEECQAVVVMVDGDKEGDYPKDEHRVKKRWKDIQDQLKKGFDAAKSNVGETIECIRMVPMRTIGSWLMADPEAFERATGVNRDDVAQVKNPESLWGKDTDPASNYPKNVMNRLLEDSRLSANRETCRLIAEEIDLDVLKERCPISAAPFIAEAQQAFSRLTCTT